MFSERLCMSPQPNLLPCRQSRDVQSQREGCRRAEGGYLSIHEVLKDLQRCLTASHRQVLQDGTPRLQQSRFMIICLPDTHTNTQISLIFLRPCKFLNIPSQNTFLQKLFFCGSILGQLIWVDTVTLDRRLTLFLIFDKTSTQKQVKFIKT